MNDLPRTAGTGFLVLVAMMLAECSWAALAADPFLRPWRRHVIDDTSRGADGVRLADVNGDGLPDVVTGWEEGGLTRVYIHPGPAGVSHRWPAVTVGRTPNVEDAVLVDLDQDGRMDVVSSCEGPTRSVFVHWAPRDEDRYLAAEAWTTRPLPASRGRMMWMFCLPMQVDGRYGVDLVAGGKGSGAQIGWFEAPAEARRLEQWRWHPLGPAGWVMSLRAMDVDADGDADILFTDRKGSRRGCRWFENPGPGHVLEKPWDCHFLGGGDHEVMFLDVADVDADGRQDVLIATRDNGLLLLVPPQRPGGLWQQYVIRLPENTGTGKGVAVGDIDGDRRPDVVFSCENAGGGRHGVMWLAWDRSPRQAVWRAYPISGPQGIKFDRLELVDLDRDGDLDVLACEESQPAGGRRRGLGVFWYQNPSK